MSLLSCLLYMAANVVLMVILWFYHRARHRQQLMRRDHTTLSVDEAFVARVSVGPARHVAHSSLLSLIGLQESRTFFSFEDHFSTYEEVADACRRAGLEKCQLIVGVDFSASNEWQGRKTFSSQCLHRVVPGKILNPYQKVISIIGRTLESFDQDNYIPTFGFADKQTNGDGVFPFTLDPRGCQGFSEVLERYDRVATQVNLGGPTSFAPIIREAITLVQQRNAYHILIIIADGQVNEYKPTVEAIVEASTLPLSIVVVGVGDGPWDAMEQFDDYLPERHFDNFQFVNFHKVTAKRKNPDASLALHVMMEIPDQYKTIKSLGYLERSLSSHDKLNGDAGAAGATTLRKTSPSLTPARSPSPSQEPSRLDKVKAGSG
ncbi:hypothetical protein ACOMHN_038557 [Nucella lapillus]